MGRAGLEPAETSASSVAERCENDAKHATLGDDKQREVSAVRDVVEAALAKAIEAEVDVRASGWEARVALLAGELRARRLARSGVVPIDTKRRRHGF